jgi:hypothetical protein
MADDHLTEGAVSLNRLIQRREDIRGRNSDDDKSYTDLCECKRMLYTRVLPMFRRVFGRSLKGIAKNTECISDERDHWAKIANV